ncbi:MAG TPA: GTPase HflX [Opitutae bacterium]|nr:GTPase HflX [Opitutae bacterium]HAF58038.1 GTPase HflX [Opitutae bacterium]
MFEVKEKPRLVERAFLISCIRSERDRSEADSLLDELDELTRNLGIAVIGRRVIRIRKTSPRFILGKGKVDDVVREIKECQADVLIFDNEISPAQQRNWETESQVLVIDRHEIILDVFAERAQTKEAKLQVKLARLEYSLPRLRRAWTHLGRQRGGGVTQRGEGEAQIELDQRMVRDQIAATRKEIVLVAKQRQTGRSRRQRLPLPSVAIVGYTNAGKSTLLNKLTGANAISEDKLFATLDPTSRRLKLPSGRIVVLTDTVGFIRKLPHRLVDSFKATLEEALVADLILHLVDLSNPEYEAQMETTAKVLAELGAADKELLTVYNKIDQLENGLEKLKAKRIFHQSVFISAQTGDGISNLLAQLEEIFSRESGELLYLIPFDRYDLVARLKAQGELMEEETSEDGYRIKGTPRGELRHALEGYREKGEISRSLTDSSYDPPVSP